MNSNFARTAIKSRIVKTFSVAALAVVALSGCGNFSLEEAIQGHTVDLENGGTVECVVISGYNTIDCIDATYMGPESDR